MLYLFLVLICVTRPYNVPGMLRRDISRRFIIIIIIITLFDSHSVWLYAPVCTRRRGENLPHRISNFTCPGTGFSLHRVQEVLNVRTSLVVYKLRKIIFNRAP